MKFSIARVQRTYAYWAVIGLFALGNLWTAWRYRAALGEGLGQRVSIGFPFPFQVGGGGNVSEFLVTGLLLDLVSAWTLALVAAWISLSLQRRRNARHRDAHISGGGQQQPGKVDAGIEAQETADH